MNTRRASELATIASDVRSERKLSATMPSRSVTTSSVRASILVLRGMAAITGTPALFSPWSTVLTEWSMKWAVSPTPMPMSKPSSAVRL